MTSVLNASGTVPKVIPDGLIPPAVPISVKTEHILSEVSPQTTRAN